MKKITNHSGHNSLAHLRGEKETIVKRQYPFRYTDALDKDLEVIYRLQYPPRYRNTTLMHAIKIASAYIKKIDPKKELAPDMIKDILKEKLGLEGKDLK